MREYAITNLKIILSEAKNKDQGIQLTILMFNITKILKRTRKNTTSG
jgi:hypothetical protein